jgi:hypothetical protein
MPKYTAADWDEVRKKFRSSIMAETSLISLAQSLDIEEWPHAGEEEKPSKYIDFTWDELLMMPEIAGKTERAELLTGILKETLAFDDPFGEMAAQVGEESAKENPILKTLSRLNIPQDFPLQFSNFSEGTRAVCASEGIKTIGEFATLGQQMATRVVLGGDFRNALNALSHGDEEGIGQFLPYRKGSTGLHLAEAVGIIAAGLPRADQLALGKFHGAKLTARDSATVVPTITKEQADKLENSLRANASAVFDWFKDQKADLLKKLSEGLPLERYFIVINDPAREAIAVRLTSAILAAQIAEQKKEVASAPAAEKKGFFGRLFGRR